jgi:hypothetical protein
VGLFIRLGEVKAACQCVLSHNKFVLRSCGWFQEIILIFLVADEEPQRYLINWARDAFSLGCASYLLDNASARSDFCIVLQIFAKHDPRTMLEIQAAFCCEYRSDHTARRRQVALDRNWSKMGPVDMFETQKASEHPNKLAVAAWGLAMGLAWDLLLVLDRDVLIHVLDHPNLPSWCPDRIAHDASAPVQLRILSSHV